MKSNLITTQNDLPESARRKAINLLNQNLADAIDLRLHAKQAHWNVKGPNFIGLHELFDEVEKGISELADEFAERAVQLGGIATGLAKDIVNQSRLPDYPPTILSCREHVEALSGSIAAFGKVVREAIDLAAGFKDADTSDLFTQASRSVDKLLWKVEAHGQAKN